MQRDSPSSKQELATGRPEKVCELSLVEIVRGNFECGHGLCFSLSRWHKVAWDLQAVVTETQPPSPRSSPPASGLSSLRPLC